MKSIKGRWIIAVVAIIVLVICGCSGTNISQEKKVKKALKKVYNEDFIIHEIDNSGLDCEATVSPVNNPEILFTVKVLPDGNVENSGYYHAYVNYLLEKVIESELKEFFPDSFIRMRKTCLRWEGGLSQDFKSMTIEEIMDNSVAYEVENVSGCYLEIYVNKGIGSTKEYEKEYDFFTNTINTYIQQKKMIPITVTIYYVDKSVLTRLEEYYKKDLDRDSIFMKQVLGVDRIESGITGPKEKNLGNPPNITICFKEDKELFVESFDEYKRRREEIENVK